MKVGDLVKSVGRSHKYGIGIVTKRLNKKQNPFITYEGTSEDNIPEVQWAVLWTNPLWTMKDGCSVEYQIELEVISEISKR